MASKFDTAADGLELLRGILANHWRECIGKLQAVLAADSREVIDEEELLLQLVTAEARRTSSETGSIQYRVDTSVSEAMEQYDAAKLLGPDAVDLR